MINKRTSFFFLFLLLVFVCSLFIFPDIRSIFYEVNPNWAIGILSGPSPFSLSPPNDATNPTITARNINDLNADFVADPFMIHEKGIYYMFFEVMNSSLGKGDIGLATSTDGLSWSYQQIILSESYSISYPYVFKWNNSYYMIPETSRANSIRLYEASVFPICWKYKKTLIAGKPFCDSSLFYYEDKWWLFSSINHNKDLALFFSDDLMGDWQEHLNSPVIKNNAHISRPAGRILQVNNRLFRFAQDDEPKYGTQVRAFEILNLTPLDYKEVEFPANPVIKFSNKGWNRDGMHTIDIIKLTDNKWIACVDGYRKKRKVFSIFKKWSQSIVHSQRCSTKGRDH